MKISFLFGLLCLTPTPALSRRLSKASKKNGQDQYYDELSAGGHYQHSAGENEYYTIDGSMEYGYLEAKMLWSKGSYKCDSITQEYWVQVQKIVFNSCDSKWPASSKWAKYSQDCKTGVEKFTVEQMDNCFDVEECKQVGVSAAASVVGIFCKQNGLFHEGGGGWIPVKCVQYAEVSCEYDAVETAQKFIEGGVCGNGSGMDYLDEIHQLCQKELDAMLEAAQLTLI